MKNISRDTRLAIGTLLLLMVITALVAVKRQGGPEYPRLSSLSSAPDGALALKLWVKELNYRVDEQVLASFAPPETSAILFMLEPLFPAESEMQSIDDWVEGGGTLIAVGEQYGLYSVVDHYQFSFSYLRDSTSAPVLATPLFGSPPAIIEPRNAKVRLTLASEREDYVILATFKGRPVLVSFEQGKGRVILGTFSESFTNAGLKQTGNPELLLNILALARNRGTVWFDEWHHGLQSGEQIVGPAEFLRSTPVGRSLLFAALVVFIVLLMQGRAFGRPVPLPQQTKRRAALEHVTGVANLSRRAAHRPEVMMYYHQQIKRKLGQRYRLDPGLDDAAYVDALAGYNPSLDKDKLRSLLDRLQRTDIGEMEMVHLAAEASQWIDN